VTEPGRAEAARRVLRTAHDCLIWQLATPPDAVEPADHLVGPLWVRLDELVTELADNSIEASEVQQWLASKLRNAVPFSWRVRHGYRWCLDEIPSSLVRVPKTTRKRWQRQEKESPRRVGSIDGRHGFYIDNRTGESHMLEATIETHEVTLAVQAAVAESGDLAKKIHIKITEGDGKWSRRRLAKELGKTRHEVTITLAEIGERLPDYAPERRNGN
jgi:hypothetical protein